jgi:hypothetical protein
MNYLALGLLAAAAAFIVLVPQPEPVLLMPEPRRPLLGRRRGRHEQETFEDARTLDWLIRVRLASNEEIPVGVNRDGNVVTFRPDASAETIHHTLQQPPWEPAPAPAVQRETMYWPGSNMLRDAIVRDLVDHYPLPAPTASELAEQWAWRRAPQPIDPPPPDPEPESAPPVADPEPHAWQPGDPADTIVRGIQAITDEYLRDAPRYEDQ